MPAFIDLSGKKFGRWTVVHRDGSNKHNQPTWLCHCSCGNENIVTGGILCRGDSRSCGCLNIDVHRAQCIERNTSHGQSKTLEYNTWVNMRQRCENNRTEGFKKYGAKGIKVCKRWSKFENFLDDMGLKPTPKHTIDRKNTRGNYTPSNCRWATMKEQQNNRTNNRMVTIDGKTMTAHQWSDKLGIPYKTFHARLQSGRWY